MLGLPETLCEVLKGVWETYESYLEGVPTGHNIEGSILRAMLICLHCIAK